MKTLALRRVSLSVSNLDALQAFYTEALGFEPLGLARPADPGLAALYGADRVSLVDLQRGSQRMELAAFQPRGAPYPADRHGNDLLFQHVALVCDDIAAAYATLSRHAHIAISRRGPEKLPGGIIAYKFRDPDGHPLELIEFQTPNAASAGGIDHSAISVADVQRSITFYTQELGLSVASRQVNTGPAQDALDGLDAVVVDVVGLAPQVATPHVELLGYRAPRGRPEAARRPADIAASRLVLEVDTLAQHPQAMQLADGSRAVLIHDPDGHALLLLDPSMQPRDLNA